MLYKPLSLLPSLSPSLLWFYYSSLPKMLWMMSLKEKKKTFLNVLLTDLIFIIYPSGKMAGDLCVYI